MRYYWGRFLRNESGATAIEYGLIAALIAVICIGAFRSIGSNIRNEVTAVESATTFTEVDDQEPVGQVQDPITPAEWLKSHPGSPSG